QRKAGEAESILREVRGAAGVASTRVAVKPYLEIALDQNALARWGVQAGEVLDVIEAGLGGKVVSTIQEGRRRFPIQIRFEADERTDLERIGELLVATSSGTHVSLSSLTRIRRVEGPAEIHSEN